MFRLYQFSDPSGGGEFVVISERPDFEVRDEYADGDIVLDDVLEIDGDATTFPCDHSLRAM